MSNEFKKVLSVIDLGNYNVKGINQDGKQETFKSNVSRDYESYPDAFKYTLINGEYTYFERGTFSLEYIKTNKDYIAQLLYSISKLHADIKDIKTKLTLLLPIGEMNHKTKYIETLDKKIYQFTVKNSKKMDKKVMIEDILVVPEGYASYFVLEDKYKTSSLLLIDIGGRTTNLVAMVNGEPKLLKTLKIGIIDFYSKLKELNSDKEYNLEDIERLIKEGEIKVTEKQLAEFTNDILNEIKIYVKFEHYKHVAWTGGGAIVIEKIIKEKLPKNCFILDNPLTSNIRGALEVSKITWGIKDGKEEKK
ncbi:ParM/StbA family protein [Clostridium botulinum]|uniref:ParM/StbA family protein n=1 Tax=Clostridium botulinum TaxID=1491 RepID=UPI0013C747AA|nr:ParM/StbA family protein [Clostridium botulinum]MBN1042190.1 exopolyphosphatase [Clostridium botulinum]NFN17423.1 ParM/StbA family protein [Clostridium botulinum]NFN48916.1 ParM/StbA family protein [Clostridium botulinum]NFO41778.1 ParM/StbA family protein [Clostridium botulinum]